MHPSPGPADSAGRAWLEEPLTEWSPDLDALDRRRNTPQSGSVGSPQSLPHLGMSWSGLGDNREDRPERV
jgi:hypothetical protein